MLPNSLRFKVGFTLAIGLSAALLPFAAVLVKLGQDALLETAATHVSQLSEIVIRSTRFAMLKNQPDYVHSILADVAHQEKIDRVRIFSKEGVIIDSSYAAEIGLKVNLSAEGCYNCHQGAKPLLQIPSRERARIFANAEGKRMLASMEVIRNEPSCTDAACHVHTKAQSVLGVLDIVYSLEEIDRSLQTSGITIVVFSLGLVIVASAFLSVFVHRLVYVPLRDLEAGSKRLSSGNLEQPIPVRSADEFGELAESFNAMTAALRNSRQELQEWGRTLEQKVTERTEALRLAQSEAARGEKLASVGLLAAGIAHELNNPLTGVLTFSSLIRKKIPDGAPEAEDLDVVIREAKRCAAIIRRLLDFAREKTPEKQYADLNRLIEDTVRIIEKPAYLRDIGITMDLDPTLPRVWVDADLIRQVIMNMLVNAQHAIEKKGSITVRSRRAPQPRSPEPGARPVAMAEMAIIDTGCGIPEQDMKRIFDPFFTTKGVGKGTGLGLAVSHGIVEAHGGAIEVASKVGEGTTFRVFLPFDGAPPAAVGWSNP